MTLQIESLAPKDLERRVCGEYNDMPGLRLTLAQACRLWGMDSRTSEIVLQRLVARGFLRQVGPYYIRADLGHVSSPHRTAARRTRGARAD